ncbi:hypothetical protein B7Y94_03635 [Candidatus Saccharibacteria bacterium 32-49-12]|nr:MAG: hypothetical protein B7Y94_03635 [Candidatus Saccharibacteria bacterium 32-49-12]
MSQRIDVIKARGKRPSEEFNPGKLKQSIIAACLSLRAPEGQAEEIAQAVEKGVLAWCEGKSEITSDDIRRVGAAILQKHHTEAAYLYKQQLTVL